MNTGIKPATGKGSPILSLHRSWPGPSQVPHNSCLPLCMFCPSAGRGHLPWTRTSLSSCWACREFKALATPKSGELDEIMSLSRKKCSLTTDYKQSSIWFDFQAQSVFLSCTQTLWGCSIHLAHLYCPHRTWGTMGNWHKHDSPAAFWAESDSGISYLLITHKTGAG